MLLRRDFLAAASAPGATAAVTAGRVTAAGARPTAAMATAAEAVDLLLVLAADVSGSMDDAEQRLQREGYRAALLDARVLAALGGGPAGAVGLAYLEWAGAGAQRLVLPWTRITGRADAEAWVGCLAAAPGGRPAAAYHRPALALTSISGAIDFSRRLLAEAPWPSERRVIDVSGDGRNNAGGPPEDARDRTVAAGITVNGLPIIRPGSDTAVNELPGVLGGGPPEPPDQGLEAYFRAAVVGGAGAFTVAAQSPGALVEAIRRKLLREVASGSAGSTARA